MKPNLEHGHIIYVIDLFLISSMYTKKHSKTCDERTPLGGGGGKGYL